MTPLSNGESSNMAYTFTPAEDASFKAAKQTAIASRALHVVADRGRREDGDRYVSCSHVFADMQGYAVVAGSGVDESKRWYSKVGETDDFNKPITDTIYDACTTTGQWGLMSPESFARHVTAPCRLGTGIGQKYRLRPDGVWIKVAG